MRVPPKHQFVKGIFPYKPFIWGYSHLWKPPFICVTMICCKLFIFCSTMASWILSIDENHSELEPNIENVFCANVPMFICFVVFLSPKPFIQSPLHVLIEWFSILSWFNDQSCLHGFSGSHCFFVCWFSHSYV